MIIDCPIMETFRARCEIGRLIRIYRAMQPQISSIKMYSMILNDSDHSCINEIMLSLYFMKSSWNTKVGIDI